MQISAAEGKELGAEGIRHCDGVAFHMCRYQLSEIGHLLGIKLLVSDYIRALAVVISS
jgi:hypothetical protein